jgi:hypothetical protein
MLGSSTPNALDATKIVQRKSQAHADHEAEHRSGKRPPGDGIVHTAALQSAGRSNGNDTSTHRAGGFRSEISQNARMFPAAQKLQ